jgi:hypothetical protein
MRTIKPALAVAMLLGLASAPPAVAQSLSYNDMELTRIGYRPHPYYMEREMRRRDDRRHSRRSYDDDRRYDRSDRRRYRGHHPAYVYPRRYHPPF